MVPVTPVKSEANSPESEELVPLGRTGYLGRTTKVKISDIEVALDAVVRRQWCQQLQ